MKNKGLIYSFFFLKVKQLFMHNGLDKHALHLIQDLINVKIAFDIGVLLFYLLVDLCEQKKNKMSWCLESTLYVCFFPCISNLYIKYFASFFLCYFIFSKLSRFPLAKTMETKINKKSNLNPTLPFVFSFAFFLWVGRKGNIPPLFP